MTGQADAEKNKVVTINGETYNVIKTVNGFCDGCDFLHYENDRIMPCPGLAIRNCISGNILKK
jgi:hypothetical protein